MSNEDSLSSNRQRDSRSRQPPKITLTLVGNAIIIIGQSATSTLGRQIDFPLSRIGKPNDSRSISTGYSAIKILYLTSRLQIY